MLNDMTGGVFVAEPSDELELLVAEDLSEHELAARDHNVRLCLALAATDSDDGVRLDAMRGLQLLEQLARPIASHRPPRLAWGPFVLRAGM